MINTTATVHSNKIIARYANGIKLLAAQHTNTVFPSVGDIFKLPLQFYFCDTDHKFLAINQETARINGFMSETDAQGKTVNNITKKSIAQELMANNLKILRDQSMQCIEERLLRKDGTYFQGISIKFPWYGENNKLLGIFGCSIVVDPQNVTSLANALGLLVHTNLLSANQLKIKPLSVTFPNLSTREQDILRLVTHGKTARQAAEILQLSKRTVEHYIDNLKNKMNVKSKSELIEKSMQFLYPHIRAPDDQS